MKIRTIDIDAKEWFDKTYGNSYFSGTVTVNFGMKTERTFKMPFQYGYGDSYVYAGFDLLEKEKLIKRNHPSETWNYCDENNIILRKHIQTGCLKREVIQ